MTEMRVKEKGVSRDEMKGEKERKREGETER